MNDHSNDPDWSAADLPGPIPPEGPGLKHLTREEVVGRLCQLQADVCHELLGFDTPNDCFCFDRNFGGHPTDHFITTGAAIQYIEEAVKAALAQDKERKSSWLTSFQAKCRERVVQAVEEVG